MVIATLVFVTLVERVFVYEMLALCREFGFKIAVGEVFPFMASVALINGAAIVTVASCDMYATASAVFVAETAVPTVNRNTRVSRSCPTRTPVSAMVRVAPGARVPSVNVPALNGIEESVTEKPNGVSAFTMMFSSGTVAFERTERVSVSGFPDTASWSVSTETDNGAEEMVSV